MRYLLLLLTFLSSINSYAQDPTVFFLKNNGAFLNKKDSADLIRVVTEPENGSALYTIADYYLSGKQKQLFKSKFVYPVKIEGTLLSFYENGRRRSIENFKNGQNIGTTYQYYPNGKIYLVTQYPEMPLKETSGSVKRQPTDFVITEAYDSLGTATVVEANGPCVIYSADFKEIAEQGMVKSGKRHGLWIGSNKALSTTFEETYADGVFLSGKAQFEGSTISYSQRSSPAKFPGGDAAFGKFLARQIKYPAVDRNNQTEGRVIVAFEVAKDGTLTNFFIAHSVSEGLNNEAIRVLKTSPKWLPATNYGQPIKVGYTVPISFGFASETY